MKQDIAPGIEVIPGGGVASPEGITVAGVAAGIKQSGKPDIALVYSDTPADFAGAFTTCKFAAAPVQLCRQRMKAGNKIQAVIINSGNANACTGDEGLRRAESVAELTAEKLNISPDSVLVSSTGRIGVQLPVEKIEYGLDVAVNSLSRKGSLAAEAIMTTDTVKKEIAVTLHVDGKDIVIGGMTKGSGMIAPEMTVPHATMLAYITTDAEVGRQLLAQFLDSAVKKTFNRITVDGDMSTNDTVILMANGRSGVKIEPDTADAELFLKGLTFVMEDLARKIVRDGEGATKFVTVEVVNAVSESDARKCAEAIANSLLCKTAWFGGDPNWGRVLAAVGYSGAEFNPEQVDFFYDDKPVVLNGQDAGTPELELAEILKNSEFKVKIDFKAGNACYNIWTNDISYEYVKINAEYHT